MEKSVIKRNLDFDGTNKADNNICLKLNIKQENFNAFIESNSSNKSQKGKENEMDKDKDKDKNVIKEKNIDSYKNFLSLNKSLNNAKTCLQKMKKYSSSNKRKKSNKEASRRYRNKKKTHIKALENKVEQLEAKLNFYQKAYKNAIGSGNTNNTFDSITRLNSFNDMTFGREKLLFQMKDTLKRQDKEGIKSIVEQYKLKYGSKSINRKKCTEYLISKYFDIILPYAYRYLLFSASENNGYFNPDNKNNCIDFGKNYSENLEDTSWDSITKSVRIPLNTKLLIENKKEFIIQTRNIMSEKAQEIMNYKENMLETMENFEKELNNCYLDSVDCSTLAQFLVWIEERKYSEELSNEKIYNLSINEGSIKKRNRIFKIQKYDYIKKGDLNEGKNLSNNIPKMEKLVFAPQ